MLLNTALGSQVDNRQLNDRMLKRWYTMSLCQLTSASMATIASSVLALSLKLWKFDNLGGLLPNLNLHGKSPRHIVLTIEQRVSTTAMFIPDKLH